MSAQKTMLAGRAEDDEIVIATEPHRQALEARLRSNGLDVAGARNQSNDRELSRQAGFDHHLVKPVDMEKLEALLKIADSPSLPHVASAHAAREKMECVGPSRAVV